MINMFKNKNTISHNNAGSSVCISSVNGENTVTVCGKTYNTPKGNVSVNGENIYVNGKKIDIDDPNMCSMSGVVNIEIHGDCGDIKCDGNITINGSAGSVNAGGNIVINQNVNGNVSCGGNAHVGGDVEGDLSAGGNVSKFYKPINK